MKYSCFPKIQIKIKIMSFSLAEGKALVRGCSVSEIPQRSEDNCGALLLKKEIVKCLKVNTLYGYCLLQ